MGRARMPQDATNRHMLPQVVRPEEFLMVPLKTLRHRLVAYLSLQGPLCNITLYLARDIPYACNHFGSRPEAERASSGGEIDPQSAEKHHIIIIE